VRVVADTNTLVSAFLWGGAPAAVLTAAREQRLSLFTSATLIAELEDVLGREKFLDRIIRVGSTVSDLLAGYRALAQIVRTTEIAPVSRDPDDEQVLACALAANAHLIVTRDQDLRTLDPFRTIRILPARDALLLLTESGG
jgi:uncharacterized protein